MLSVNGLLVHVNRLNKVKVVSKIQMTVTNKVEEIDPETSCRLCLMKENSGNLFCLFGSNKMFNDFSIASALMECFGIDLKQDSGLPNCVCMKCASTTLQCYTFRKCLQRCQGYLEEWRKLKTDEKKHIKQTPNNENMVPEDSSILYNYLLKNAPQNSQRDITSQREIITLSLNDNDKSANHKDCIFAEHNYHTILSDEDGVEQNVTTIKDVGDHVLKEGDKVECTIELDQSKTLKTKHNIVRHRLDYHFHKKNEIQKNLQRWWSKELGPPYDCKLCGRSYGVRFRAFYTHVRMHYTSKLSCSICGKKFTRHKMAIHMRSHTKERPYICDQCPARFTIEGNLKRHLTCHTGERLYVCDICGKSFTQSSSLQGHKQLHAENISIVCVYCGKVYKSNQSYRVHAYLNHNENRLTNNDAKEEEEESQDEHRCFTCGKVFKKAFALRLHLQVHKTESKTYNCTLCLRRYNSHFNFRIHTLWHELKMEDESNEQKDWPCDFCDQIFEDKKLLRSHIRTHMQRPYLCTICDKGYVTKGALSNHVRQHSDKKPFSCTSCDKRFTYFNNMKQHMRVHTGEKPHKCRICSHSFAQQQQLVSHTYTHTGEKKYICPYCGKAFALNGNLTVHKRRHTGETPFVCDICSKGFYDSSSLKKHKQGKHKVNFVNNNDDAETRQKIEAVESLLLENE